MERPRPTEKRVQKEEIAGDALEREPRQKEMAARKGRTKPPQRLEEL